MAPLLQVEHLSKRYWATQALSDVSFGVNRGEVLGLVGENGAGKSTLLNVLSGCQRPDEGRVLLDGEEVAPRSYHDATLLGIFRIFQELSLVPNLAVYENLFLSHEGPFMRGGIISRGAMVAKANELLEEFDHGWIDPRKPAGSFDFATRQVLEIIKAFALSALLEVERPVILLDEPTAALSRDEIDFLMKLLADVRRRATIVYVSHRLSEVIELSDRLLVLKDGAVVAELEATDMQESDLHMLMVGRVRDEQLYKEDRQRESAGPPRLAVRNLSRQGHFDDVTLEVGEGEIVGVAGVLGSGKSSLGQAIFGMHRDVDGQVAIDGAELSPLSIRSALRAGLGYVTPDRQEEGILGSLPVAWNISVAQLGARGWSSGPLLDLRAERRQARHHVEQLRIKTPDVDTLVEGLSGGNQQKVILARWLAFGVKVMVLDNPTRGVDAGAKEEIYGVLRDLADQGVALLLISDDLLELIGLANRVLVMKDGVIVKELDSDASAKPHEADVVAEMV